LLRDSSLWRDHFGRKRAYLPPISARLNSLIWLSSV
jgi:hypothetical protein